jgi:hypothetical protein
MEKRCYDLLLIRIFSFLIAVQMAEREPREGLKPIQRPALTGSTRCTELVSTVPT